MAAAPDFALAAAFLVTWLAPTTFGQQAVRHLMNVMLLEFLVVHATGALGAVALSGLSRSMKGTMFSGLAVVYFFFVGAVSKICGSVWPLVSFYGLMLAKLPTVVFGMRQADGKKGTMLWWPMMTVAYVMGAFLTTFLPVPRFGITAEVVVAQDFVDEGGLWVPLLCGPGSLCAPADLRIRLCEQGQFPTGGGASRHCAGGVIEWNLHMRRSWPSWRRRTGRSIHVTRRGAHDRAGHELT
ncbi:MAG: hypothetical protein ACYS1C_12525 [Planctomycetota bacterium]|jgi:hypothetical protein